MALVALARDWTNPGRGKSRRGSRYPKRAWAVALAFGLREMELAGLTLHASSVKVWWERGVLMARPFLPLTKNDEGGKGSARTWSCVCSWPVIPDGDVRLGTSGLY